MDRLNIPEVYPVADGKTLYVPSNTWNAMCDTVNKLIEVVNIQSKAIEELTSKCADLETSVTDNTTNISKIAKLLGDMYETLY